MSKPTLPWFGQMTAALGVMISMGFVAYELKQSRDLAIAELLQSQGLAMAQTYINVLDVDTYNSGLLKIEQRSDEELTWAEERNIIRVYTYEAVIYRNGYALWKMGLIPDEEWQSREEQIKRWMQPQQQRRRREFWNPENWRFRGAFTERLHELWVEVNGEQPVAN